MNWINRVFGKTKQQQSKIKSTALDKDGQPVNSAFNAKRRLDRGIHEMLGLIKGILMDGRVDDNEIISLNNWIEANNEIVNHWPVSVIKQRIEIVLEDGVIDEDERKDLQELFNRTIGSDDFTENQATTLPIDKSIRSVVFEGKTFVLTGKFYYGIRKKCEGEVIERGGVCYSNVTKRTNYLIIGTAGSRDWVHTSWGRKIEKAVEYKESGVPIKILNEEKWCQFL